MVLAARLLRTTSRQVRAIGASAQRVDELLSSFDTTKSASSSTQAVSFKADESLLKLSARVLKGTERYEHLSENQLMNARSNLNRTMRKVNPYQQGSPEHQATELERFNVVKMLLNLCPIEEQDQSMRNALARCAAFCVPALLPAALFEARAAKALRETYLKHMENGGAQAPSEKEESERVMVSVHGLPFDVSEVLEIAPSMLVKDKDGNHSIMRDARDEVNLALMLSGLNGLDAMLSGLSECEQQCERFGLPVSGLVDGQTLSACSKGLLLSPEFTDLERTRMAAWILYVGALSFEVSPQDYHVLSARLRILEQCPTSDSAELAVRLLSEHEEPDIELLHSGLAAISAGGNSEEAQIVFDKLVKLTQTTLVEENALADKRASGQSEQPKHLQLCHLLTQRVFETLLRAYAQDETVKSAERFQKLDQVRQQMKELAIPVQSTRIFESMLSVLVVRDVGVVRKSHEVRDWAFQHIGGVTNARQLSDGFYARLANVLEQDPEFIGTPLLEEAKKLIDFLENEGMLNRSRTLTALLSLMNSPKCKSLGQRSAAVFKRVVDASNAHTM
ncbi:MAG: hypothetical protein MHM6MM_003582 [Cercozoa sp. M6MM]